MKNLILAIFFRATYDNKLRVIATKIFKYFPSLKPFLIYLRDNGFRSNKKESKNILIDNNLLNSIKKNLKFKKFKNSNLEKQTILLADKKSQNRLDILSKAFPNINFIFNKSKSDNIFLIIDLSPSEKSILNYLSNSDIVITLKSNAIYKIARDMLEYLIYDVDNEIIELISLYYDNQDIYNAKKLYISQSYLPKHNIKPKQLTIKHLEILQFVFISIDIENLKKTIKATDKYCDFVKEYIIVTSPKLILKFQQLKSKHKIIIIDETTILKEYAKDFAQRDHQSKNWLLRASLLNINFLEKEFIMLDDDNQPLKPINIDKFIAKDKKYNAFYFHNLLLYNYKTSSYDLGQQNTKEILISKGYSELLSYSSHSPQIINKIILEEVVKEFFEIGLEKPIDEWSIYFNYCFTYYPSLFNKKLFQTLNWPANPYQFDIPYEQDEISFENYYKEIYETNIFSIKNTYKEKIAIKNQQLQPFIHSKKLFLKNKILLSDRNMVYGVCNFENEEIKFYLLSIPYYIQLEQNSSFRLKLNYKFLNKRLKRLKISLVIFLDGNYKTLRNIDYINSSRYQESIIEIPFSSSKLQNGIYEISFHLLVENNFIYKISSPYKMKLVVSKDL